GHARRCLDHCQSAGIGDWDLPYACKALSRAASVAGDAEGAASWRDRARGPRATPSPIPRIGRVSSGLRDALEVLESVSAVGPGPVLDPCAETGLHRIAEDVATPVVHLVFLDRSALEAFGKNVAEPSPT